MNEPLNLFRQSVKFPRKFPEKGKAFWRKRKKVFGEREGWLV